MKKKMFYKKVSLLVLFSLIVSSFVVFSSIKSKSSDVAYNSFAQQKQIATDGILICPTYADPGKPNLQMEACYLITNTPMPTNLPVPSAFVPNISSGASPASPSPTTAPSLSSLCPPPGDLPSVLQQLSSVYKISLVGADLLKAQEVYTTMCVVYHAPSYANLIGQVNISLINSSGCTGVTRVDINNVATISISGWCDKYINRFVLTHELGHVVALRNPSIYNDWYSHVWPAVLSTYNCQLDYVNLYPGPYPAECFADMIGEYFVYYWYRDAINGQPLGNTTFAEYPTAYAVYYNFAHDKLFNGVTFDSF